MSSGDWDARYSATDRVWSSQPNMFVVELTQDLPTGSALDVATGEGRNALWLAEQGWDVTAVDFSPVGVERGKVSPGGDEIDWQVADVTNYVPGRHFDLVLLCYLHLPRAEAHRMLERATSWVAPGGRLVVIGHAVRNLTEGVGGPQDPDLLMDEELLATSAQSLTVERLEVVERVTDSGTAIDVILRARRH